MNIARKDLYAYIPPFCNLKTEVIEIGTDHLLSIASRNRNNYDHCLMLFRQSDVPADITRNLEEYWAHFTDRIEKALDDLSQCIRMIMFKATTHLPYPTDERHTPYTLSIMIPHYTKAYNIPTGPRGAKDARWAVVQPAIWDIWKVMPVRIRTWSLPRKIASDDWTKPTGYSRPGAMN